MQQRLERGPSAISLYLNGLGGTYDPAEQGTGGNGRVALGMLPGHIARKRQHPWAEAVSIGGWVTLIFGFVFWPLVMIWAYVDAPAPAKPEARR